MEFLIVDTVAGHFAVRGRAHAGRTKPSLVVVTGSFPPKAYMAELETELPSANVLLVNFPGMEVAWFGGRVPLLTEGLGECVDFLIGDAPFVLLGASTGNLITLGLRRPNLRRRMALEPFFTTEHLWPFIAYARDRMAANPAHEALRRYLWVLFGIAPERTENRDYRYLLEGLDDVPMDVIAGGMPLLPERQTNGWPSFTSPEERAALAARPGVTLHEGPAHTGHNYGWPREGFDLLRQLCRDALADIGGA